MKQIPNDSHFIQIISIIALYIEICFTFSSVDGVKFCGVFKMNVLLTTFYPIYFI